MPLTTELVENEKRLIKENYVIIERLKKLRALNCNPRFAGINPRFTRILERKR
jgi:hypothetical protein